ncbi:MAG: efflux RND transporter periplasmic adaptor subunit [Deltaproteobacteria bacterium]|nr:efflux RND transporter periplasmic adaptor subunit [Deltaproteobacteria bacterium]
MQATEDRPTRVLRSAALCLLLVPHAIGCSEELPPPPRPPQPVKILEIVDAGARRTYDYPGEISAIQHAEPAFEVAGKIIKFPVIEGQEIAAGDIIAILDPRDFQAALDRARANLRQGENDIERYQILFDKGVSPKTELERAKRRHDVSLADFQKAEKALDDSTLRAHFSGTVAKKLATDFENVTAKQSIIILQDESELQVDIAIPEQDYTTMARGMSNEERTRLVNPMVSISSIPGRQFPAYVKEFTTTADPTTRTFKATLAFDPPSNVSIRPGMTAKVTITPRTTGASGIAIPAKALLTDPEGKAFVWSINPDTLVAFRTDVVAGDLSGESVSIVEGLAPGDQIAVSGVHMLADGMQVRRFNR